MDNIIENKIDQTPIEIALGIDEDGMTTAGTLFDFLGMDRSNFSRWFRTNIIGNDFAEENIDYFLFVINDEHKGHASQDAKITASFAKKLSMQSKTAKGEQARQYFLKVEDKLKDTVRYLAPMSPLEQLQLQAQAILQVNEKVDNLSQKMERLELDLPILPVEADRITEAVKKKGTSVLGGKLSNAYKSRSVRQKVYSNIHSNLRYQFQVKTYKSIKRNQVDKAIDIIGKYEPPVFLKNEIDAENAQETMF